MELSISEQAMSLLCFAGLGLGLGLAYDLLRLPRYRLKMALLWDGLFCALAAAGSFTLSMRSGRLGTWELLLTLGTFCLYINFISKWVFPEICQIFRLFGRVVRFLEKNTFFSKISFQTKTISILLKNRKYFTFGKAVMYFRERLIRIVLLSLLLYSALSFAASGNELDRAEARQDRLGAELEALGAETQQMRTKLDAKISPTEAEQLARQRLGLVRPGEKIFYFTTDRED
jgi:cell division protein FtsB